ncbi:MAG: hypothetical protein KDM91_05265 [Verrucomicrobiae bacterium]|nr:hypothetical protein [Verrucomicrobiae bacterium]MCP5541909.1 hypothetical protein [Akkermansiaceae bacterium]MCP5551924.1 hypothetical protein [Akkermansiaceae bacterium]
MNPHTLRLILAAGSLAAFSLSSCVYYDDAGAIRDPGSGYSSSRFGYTQSAFYGDGYGGYGGYSRFPYGYGASAVCPRCHRNPCVCDRGRYHDFDDDHRHFDHDDHDRGKSKSNDDWVHRPNAYRITGGDVGTKTQPKGFHSVDWYKSRGYDVKKLRLENERGERPRSGGSSSRSSDSKKKK